MRRRVGGWWDGYTPRMRCGAQWALATLALGAAALGWDLFLRERPQLRDAAVRLCLGIVPPSCANRVIGDVHDPAGRPLAGARIRAWRQGDCSCQTTTTADGAGRYELCAWRGNFWIEAEADGHTRVRERIDVEKVPRRSFVLALQSLIMGRVTDADSGAPLRGAEIAVSQMDGPVTVKADEQGVFRVDHLSAVAGLQVNVRAEGHEPFLRDVIRTPVWIEARLDRRAEERQAPDLAHGSISGRVLRHGAPVPNAWVSVRGARGVELVTDAAGGFRAAGLPGGKYTLRATSEAIAAASPPSYVEIGAADAREGVDLDLVRAASVSGRVVNEVGVPMARADIEIDCRGARYTEQSGWDGRFRFQDLPGEGPCQFGVRADPRLEVVYREARPIAILRLEGLDAHVEGLELVVSVRRAWISGRVLDEGGHPAPGVRVHGRQECLGSAATTAADGSFVLHSQQDARFYVSVGDGTLAFRQEGPIELGRDDLVLRQVATAQIQGTLVGFPGAARLQAWTEQGGGHSAAVNDHFTLDDVPLGEVTIFAQAGNAMDLQTISVTSVETQCIVLRARPTVRVAGRLVDIAGRPVNGAVCAWAPGLLARPFPSDRLALAADGDFAVDAPVGLGLHIDCSFLNRHDRAVATIRQVPAHGTKDLRVVLHLPNNAGEHERAVGQALSR